MHAVLPAESATLARDVLDAETTQNGQLVAG